MLDLKPYGAFIENTIRPLVEEFHILFKELQKVGVNISKEDVMKLVKIVAKEHFKCMLLWSITAIILCAIICNTLWKIYQ